MKRIGSAAVCAFALIWAAGPAAAQAQFPADLINPMVRIEYVAPKTASLRAVHDRLKQRRVLERLQVFLGALKLPRQLVVKTDECGTTELPYKAGGPVTICYEYVEQVEKLSPRVGYVQQLGQVWFDRETALVGPFVQNALHQVGRALFEILDIPVWGNVEDAADNVAAITMIQFGKDVAWKTMVGTAWFLAASGDWKKFDLADIRPTLAQRYFNQLCIAYAADITQFGVFVPTNRPPGAYDLPKRRADRCRYDAFKLQTSFVKTFITPHVDPDKLRRVKAIEWLKD